MPIIAQTFTIKPFDIKVTLQDRKKRTPLWVACHGSVAASADMEATFVAIVRILLTHPEQDVNLADEHGWSPLWWMTDRCQLTIANALLEHPQVQYSI
eukprot:3927771-Pyramimonas_sp.AAC.1